MDILNVEALRDLVKAEDLDEMSSFGALSHDFIEYLLTQGSIQRFQRNEQVFAAGDRAECFYIVLRGEVALYVGHAADRKLIWKHVRGESFGFASMVGLRPRVCDALVEGHCIVLQVASSLFATLYRTNSQDFAVFFLNLSRDMSRFLQYTAEKVADIPKQK